jgi:hypothetical protein
MYRSPRTFGHAVEPPVIPLPASATAARPRSVNMCADHVSEVDPSRGRISGPAHADTANAGTVASGDTAEWVRCLQQADRKTRKSRKAPGRRRRPVQYADINSRSCR